MADDGRELDIEPDRGDDGRRRPERIASAAHERLSTGALARWARACAARTRGAS